MKSSTAKSVPAQIVDAIRVGDTSTLEILFESNPDQLHYKTPFGFQTWLGYAAGHASLEIVQFLVSRGFDVNEGDSRENIKPLASACSKGRVDVARFLLEAGATIDTEKSVQNPLFSAIVGRSLQVVRLLLDNGIDATIRYNSDTMKNMDAVAFALMQGETECARLIAERNSGGDETLARVALEEASRIADYNAFKKR